jgi:hypothetical protein
MHWMTDGLHYRVDFVTFSRILGFSSTHRSDPPIHSEKKRSIGDISYMWRQPEAADGKRSGLRSFYYILNNMMRKTINPKDGAASDLNGWIRNVLHHFSPGGQRFNVPRFMWVTLSEALDDGRRSLPYAPYLMFVIERVTGRRHTREMVHEYYRLEKLAPAAAARDYGERMSGGSERDVPETSRAQSRKQKKGINRTVKNFLRGLFTMCKYSNDTVYQTRLELRESVREYRERAGLPPLSPPPPPPHFDMPEFSDDDDSSYEQPRQSDTWEETLQDYQQRQRRQPPRRSIHSYSRDTASSSRATGSSGGAAESDDED